MELTGEYWNTRWENGQTGWDLKQPSPALVAYLEQIPMSKRHLKVLIPGCGNGYEAIWLLQNGFTRVTMLDIAPVAVDRMRNMLLQSDITHWSAHLRLICGDFFEHQDSYDLILEQTFFCALPPTMREDYVHKMHDLLAPEGKLVGLWFDRDFEGGPPFGGFIQEYITRFAPRFEILSFDKCYNSIDARKDTEAFGILKRS